MAVCRLVNLRRSDTQLSLKEAASKTCDLVVKSCAHGGKNGFDENATACPYCNAPAVAEVALNDGEGGRLRRRFTTRSQVLEAASFSVSCVSLPSR